MSEETVSISLRGADYFLCSPYDNIRRQSLDDFDHSPGVRHEFVALGEGGASIIKIRTLRNDTARWAWSSLRPNYPGLDEALDEKGEETIQFVSLGAGGRYFLRTDKFSYSNLPDGAARYVSSAAGTSDPVDAVWLGADDAYVCQKRSGACSSDLRGQYGSLARTITYSGVIVALGMNIENDRGYCLVLKHETPVCNTTGLASLDPSTFQSWAMRARR